MARFQRIAIVGIGGVFPGASDIEAFWANILAGRDVASEPPSGRWLLPVDEANAATLSPDKVNSRRACFVQDFHLDLHGIELDAQLRQSIPRLDPVFHFLLNAGTQAWADARTDTVDRSRAGVIIGNIALPTDASSSIADEILGSTFDGALMSKFGLDNRHQSRTPEQSTDPINRYVAGLPASVLARALNFGAGAYTIDAACASSLYALKLACDELRHQRADVMLAGGLSRPDSLYTQMGFSQLHAISPTGQCSPFDQQGNGLVVGEGCGMVVLKRLDDALAAGDHIYATIAGIGLSNDIEGNLMLPASEGQLRAMHQAYQNAGWSPRDVQHIECHGTGTPTGDAVELRSLVALWNSDQSTVVHDTRRCVLGSVKSNVGHLLTAAGSAGLIKSLLALRDQVLPPTAHFNRPIDADALRTGPFEVLNQGRDWAARSDQSRRAAISAFGFGGINAHVLLEAWNEDQVGRTVFVQPSNDTDQDEPIAIVGIDAAVGPWLSREMFADAFCGAGQPTGSVIEPKSPTHWWGDATADQFRGHFIENVEIPLGRYRIPPSELAAMLPQQLLMLQVAANALDDAGVSPKASHVRSGVFVGIDLDPNTTNYHVRWSMSPAIKQWSSELGFTLDAEGAAEWLLELRDAVCPPLTADRTMGSLGGIVASRIARAFHVGGPSHTVSSEETSGLHALEVAMQALRQGEIDTAIVGAVDFGGDVRTAKSYPGQTRNSQASGETADFLVADGAAAFILKRLSDAKRAGDQVYATIENIQASSTHAQRGDNALLSAENPSPWGYAGAAHEFLRLTRDVLALASNAPNTNDASAFLGRSVLGNRVALTMRSGDRQQEDRSANPLSDQQPKRVLTVPVGGKAFDPPVPEMPVDFEPASSSAVLGKSNIATHKPASVGQLSAGRQSEGEQTSNGQSAQAIHSERLPKSILQDANESIMLATSAEIAKAETQAAFLRQAQQAAAMVTQSTTFMNSFGLGVSSVPQVESVLPAVHGATEVSTNQAVAAHVANSSAVLDRNQCLEFAVGSIGSVLGAEFNIIDSYPTRVRLPDEPLMLVDRILEIEGDAGSLTHGRVVTEHDVLPGAWYLDGGRIPTCIAVEAGQADLFLSGYLGIDFRTKGKAVYRLLDAIVTFHDELPREGQTIHYDIRIAEFFRQGETHLFRFEFDATVDGRPVLTMRRGCAGFFSEAELNAGRGIIQTTMDTQPMVGVKPADWKTLAPMPGDSASAESTESYNEAQLDALRRGDLVAAFGDAFAGLPLRDPVKLPSGRMTLVHRILKLDPKAGRFGLGEIVGEADIHPDDWFLICHFVDDRVMPGTLMYECCLHTLRVYLTRMGWVGESDEFVYEPIPGESSQLKCRGQVIETTKKVKYELTLKELGYADDGTPYVLADALMHADGRPVVQMKNMSVRLSGLTRERVESLWANVETPTPAASATTVVSDACQYDLRPALYDYDSIYAFGNGNPSDAFGDRYKVFDHERKIARLPRPPYQFLDRVTSIENCEAWKLASGGVIEAQYDVPADAWYFYANGQPEMPFAVLLEAALQPCGWLAAYLGSALTSDTDLSFRNLGGSATQFLPVTRDIGTLTTQIKITSVSQSAGMIIQHYDMKMRSSRGEVYHGTTYFGFFSAEALANQVGIVDADVYQPGSEEVARAEQFALPVGGDFPDTTWRMVETVDHFDPAGGPNGLGFIRGSTPVHPDAWFFKAHFYQDPVWPGSLGLESFLQLLKVVAHRRWGDAGDRVIFQTPAIGAKHNWIYRGQVLPTDEKVTVQAVIKSVDDQTRTLVADGFLIVDGRVIYQMADFGIQVNVG